MNLHSAGALPAHLGLTEITSREQWLSLSPDVRLAIRQDDFRRMALRNPTWFAAPSRLERAYPDDEKPYYVTQAGIAVIRISGPLVNRESWFYVGYPAIRRQVGDAATDAKVKGILLWVNSPGGETDGAFEAADDIEVAAALKPVWAVADSDAFSAGYLLASATSRIYVQPQTGGVGSIGVICQHVDYSEWLKHEGLKVTAVFAGDRKNDFTPCEPLSKDARARLEVEVQRLYGLFVDAVARRRRMSTDAVRATEAGLYFGTDGIGAKLADQAGGFRAALDDLTQFVSSTGAQAGGTAFRTAAPAAVAQPEEVSPMAETTNNTSSSAAAAQQPAGADVESIRRTAEAAGYGGATEVLTLCTLAGTPERAVGYLQARTPVETVRRELLAARAERSAAEQISSEVPAQSASSARPGAEFSLANNMKTLLQRQGRIK